MINFKIYDVTDWKINNYDTPIALPNISKSKGNQTMKFGQLIECNLTNYFLEKLYAKCGGEATPKPFFLKIKI